jgi:excinuclease ABC subunit C
MIDPRTLPETSGCYLFADADGTVIYVGKAKNLKKRVASYFQKKDLDTKTRSLVAHIATVATIVTNTETEAFLLENTLIKKHQPRYNIDLKDAKRYAGIELTGGDFPRLMVARRPSGDGTFFGPFVSAAERDEIFNVIKRVFHLRTCKKFPKRPCLRRHMQSCSAPCTGAISPKEYGGLVKKAAMLLKGNTGDLINLLRQDMAERSAAQDYERALAIRDEIAAITHLAEWQHVERHREYDQDVIVFEMSEGKVYLLVFSVERGALAGKQEFTFDDGEDFFEEFLVQYYSEREPPEELVLEHRAGPALAEFLSLRKGHRVQVTAPQRGEKKNLLGLARKNLETAFFRDALKASELGLVLNLERTPSVIECFDISHLSGTAMVGSMIRFRDGKPEKGSYRRFRIRTVEGIDDVASIDEVVGRRYRRLREEGAPVPDLVIIDGGKGQLAAAMQALQSLGITIPVIAIAKQEEEVYVPDTVLPLRLDRKGIALRYIQEIRDEAHRFAIVYNRLLRKKTVVGDGRRPKSRPKKS